MHVRGALAFWTGLGFVASAAGAAEPYRLDKVAETGTTYTALGVPAVNDAGVVAFAATTAAGNGQANGVYYGAPGDVRKLATPGEVIPDVRPLDINNAGQIAFIGRDSGWFVYRSVAAGGLNIVGAAGNTAVGITGGPAISDGGFVAFISNTPTGEYLETSQGATNFTFAGPASGMLGAHVNNDGQALATDGGRVFLGHPNSSAAGNIIVGFNTPNYTDPDTGATGVIGLLTHEADAGDGGRAVFGGTHAGTGTLFVWDNGTLSKVPGTSGAVNANNVPAINDLGQVAALLSSRLSTFDAAGEHRVVAVGDAFDGSTVSALAFNAEGWNDADQLAFTATLADGRSVNVLATVPEPGAAGAAVVLAGAAALRRRRTRRR